MKEIEERIQSLAQVLASPVGDQDCEEKARRDVLRKSVCSHQKHQHIAHRIGCSQEANWDNRKAWTAVGTTWTFEVLEEC